MKRTQTRWRQRCGSAKTFSTGTLAGCERDYYDDDDDDDDIVAVRGGSRVRAVVEVDRRIGFWCSGSSRLDGHPAARAERAAPPLAAVDAAHRCDRAVEVARPRPVRCAPPHRHRVTRRTSRHRANVAKGTSPHDGLLRQVHRYIRSSIRIKQLIVLRSEPPVSRARRSPRSRFPGPSNYGPRTRDSSLLYTATRAHAIHGSSCTQREYTNNNQVHGHWSFSSVYCCTWMCTYTFTRHALYLTTLTVKRTSGE